MGLPSGQSVAKRMGVKILKQKDGLDDPLWVYILREAEELGNKGQRLGSVGQRIVAEVFVGLLAGDPQSFYNVDPGWKPDKERNKEGDFELSDFLAMADVPMTSDAINKLFQANA